MSARTKLIALLCVPALIAGCQSKETTTKTDTISTPDGGTTATTSSTTTTTSKSEPAH